MGSKSKSVPVFPIILTGTLVITLSFLVISTRTPRQTSVRAATSVCTAYQYSSKWGTYGTANGQFSNPGGAFIKGNYIYIADATQNRVQQLTLAGSFVRSFAAGQTNQAGDVFVDSANKIYITDIYNNRVLKFNFDGTPSTPAQITGISQPLGVVVDSQGNIYVSDQIASLVKKFSSAGNLITSWNTVGSPGRMAIFGNNIYVTNLQNQSVLKFDITSGTIVKQWGSSGSGNGQFLNPFGIAVDSQGYVYVADSGNRRIQKFSPDGVFVAKFGTYGSGDGQFLTLADVAVDSADKIYAIDPSGGTTFQTTRNKVFIFTCAPPTPTPVPPTPTPIPAGTNITKNPGFESGTANWYFFASPGTGGVATFSTTTNTSLVYSAPRSGVVTVTTVPTDKNLQLFQITVPMEPNRNYLLVFYARSTTGHDLWTQVIKHGSPYTNYGLKYTVVPINTAWTKHQYQFTSNPSATTDARIMFFMGNHAAAGDKYYFDNVSLTPQ